MTDTKYHHGRVVWRELMTSDIEAAKGFYGELFNWTVDAIDMGDSVYNMLKIGDRGIGGFNDPGKPDMPAHWVSYVSTPDVDAAAKAAEGAGGQILMGPMDVGPGRVAFIKDPSGAGIALWKSAQGDGELPEKPGLSDFCWDELVTPDAGKVEAFYETVVGWKMGDFDDSGAIKVFRAGEAMAGGVNTKAPEGTPSHWLNYVVVESLATSRDRAAKLGATVLMEEIPVGDFGKIAIIRDPANAVIGLFEETPKS